MKKTILFGNGLNYLSENYVSWETLLNKIKGKNLFENGKLPNTMIYERSIIGNPISFDGLTKNEEAVKIQIAAMMKDFPSNSFYIDLLQIGADNYLTTNYDYAFIQELTSNNNYEVLNKSTEAIYSIRRHKEILQKGKLKCKIWNIHGEINNPPSIMLGLDHYCGNVAKIDAYIKGRYEFIINHKSEKVDSIFKKLVTGNFDGVSWLELFFNSDVHIVGLSLDFSEIDLWWILNKRARLKLDARTRNQIRNNIFYYATSIDKDLFGLLETLNVKIVLINLDNSHEEYQKAYSEIIDKIKNS